MRRPHLSVPLSVLQWAREEDGGRERGEGLWEELERRSERLPCQGLAGKETVGPGSWGMALAKAREWRGWTQFLRHF